MTILKSMISFLKKRRQRILKYVHLKSFKVHFGYFCLGGLITGVLFPLFLVGVYLFIFNNKINPRVEVGGVKIGGMTVANAKKEVELRITNYESSRWEDNLLKTRLLPDFGRPVRFDVDESIKRAMEVGRRGDVRQRFEENWKLVVEGVKQPIVVELNDAWLSSVEASLSAQMNEPAVMPYLEIVKTNNKVVAHNGIEGKELDKTVLRRSVLEVAGNLSPLSTEVPMKKVGMVLDETRLRETEERGQKILDRELILKFEGDKAESREWKLTGEELVALIDFNKDFNKEKIETYVKGVAESVDRKPQNAKFQFDNNASKVTEFEAALDGVAVDVGETAERLRRALLLLDQNQSVDPVTLQVSRVKPEITLSEVNELGIKELLGRGFTTYLGSIPSRIHNVALAAARVNGTLVKPGETFSFNKALGDVSGATGYQAAYVIKDGRTELGDGGGVCQDSTTMFRAILDAGLPVVERRGHSYRVGYYEQNSKAGLDATVFFPSTDLKFVNDTPAHILVQARADTANKSLTFELYGTSDGRKSEIANHAVFDVTPPPPDRYQDDPTLKTGVVKQVDWKAWGAKAKFDYIVRKNGLVIYEKTFLTVYKPWASVYLRGVGN